MHIPALGRHHVGAENITEEWERQVLALTQFMVRGRERHELVNFSNGKSHHGEERDAEGLVAATPDLGGPGGQGQGSDVYTET